ncbi:MAG TPA: CBS domain-containing protein [Candidatus Bathyarchaeia archaeon]|nr:CBS domain-containing protein [Candidatus Bathyarchaeia archaeon]
MVKHVMIEDVVTAKTNITAKEAVRTLWERHIGSIVITDDKEKCIGIFTERDAIRMIASDVSLDTPIEQVMTKNVATIVKEASLEEARRLIISHGIRHVPVVDGEGKIVGMFSVRRLIDELYGLTATK